MCDTSSAISFPSVSRSGVGTIFVGGIFTGLFDSRNPTRVDEWISTKTPVSAAMTQLFQVHGEITAFTLVPPKNGKCHSVAFIEFANWESCYPAIAQYNKVFLRKKGAILQDSFLVVSHTENARNIKSIKYSKSLYQMSTSMSSSSSQSHPQSAPLSSTHAFTLPATIDMIKNLLCIRGGEPMSVALLSTLLPPGRLQKVLGEVQSCSSFSCYFLPTTLGFAASGHMFISLKRESSSSNSSNNSGSLTFIQQPFSSSESTSNTVNVNISGSMIRLQIIERLLLTPGGELPANEILLNFGIIPNDDNILYLLSLCPELDSQLSNDIMVLKLRGGLLRCAKLF
jgi:hypothetical protein